MDSKSAKAVPIELAQAEYVLKDRSAWFFVENLAIHINGSGSDEGVVVDIYPRDRILGESLATTWALYSEAEEGEAE